MMEERKDPWIAFLTGLGNIFTTIEVKDEDIEAIDKLGVDHSIFDIGIWKKPTEEKVKIVIDPDTGKKVTQIEAEYRPICEEFNNGTPLGDLAQVLGAPVVWGVQYLLPQAHENAVDVDRMGGLLKYRTMATFKRSPEDWAWFKTFLDIFYSHDSSKEKEEEKKGPGFREDQKEYLKFIEETFPQVCDSLSGDAAYLVGGLVDYLRRYEGYRKDKGRYGG